MKFDDSADGLIGSKLQNSTLPCRAQRFVIVRDINVQSSLSFNQNGKKLRNSWVSVQQLRYEGRIVDFGKNRRCLGPRNVKVTQR